jgi:hypothetical protein
MTRAQRAARDSITHIQARISGAEQGQLSLAFADQPEGALSRAEDGGELSLEPAEDSEA